MGFLEMVVPKNTVSKRKAQGHQGHLLSEIGPIPILEEMGRCFFDSSLCKNARPVDRAHVIGDPGVRCEFLEPIWQLQHTDSSQEFLAFYLGRPFW